MTGPMKKILLAFIVAMSILIIACSGLNLNRINTNTAESNSQEPKRDAEHDTEMLYEKKTAHNSIDSLFNNVPKEINKNILIVGIDARKNEPARTDTIILINIRNDKINFISIPRDTLMKLNGKNQKINAAYAYGGIDLCIASVKKLLGIEIDNYLVFNFKAIQKGVDALGGFTVTIPKTINIKDLELKKCFTLKKGSHKLNGIQTLEYLRYRSDGQGDIGRIYRQQEFIRDLQSSFLKLENVPLIPKAYLAVRDEIKTDMEASQMASYFISGYRLRNNFQYYTPKGYGKNINEISYYVLYKSSISEIKEILK